ncbi:uncharacterized protein LOC127851737 [Dreissena polymorpha]|uniref:Uncharacterized protein n=1 Tax=Dreissena polymorpha TaxID=45954 RepID=A0A9D4HSU7_DREPO|nr:uncharacterized protein LOC127851737 [Dreissena polymorpha]XP_052241560.1 uncharacterized protein LOC127851737 [Dreissena polymorpha]XP_052241561.1 uncharacterized protein LOC127851737 [Dreissena polymorpha]KAH3733780.1 hypothetical protein DPMN_040214 [Dreissena polymorpha]
MFAADTTLVASLILSCATLALSTFASRCGMTRCTRDKGCMKNFIDCRCVPPEVAKALGDHLAFRNICTYSLYVLKIGEPRCCYRYKGKEKPFNTGVEGLPPDVILSPGNPSYNVNPPYNVIVSAREMGAPKLQRVLSSVGIPDVALDTEIENAWPVERRPWETGVRINRQTHELNDASESVSLVKKQSYMIQRREIMFRSDSRGLDDVVKMLAYLITLKNNKYDRKYMLPSDYVERKVATSAVSNTTILYDLLYNLLIK